MVTDAMEVGIRVLDGILIGSSFGYDVNLVMVSSSLEPEPLRTHYLPLKGRVSRWDEVDLDVPRC